LNPQGRGSTALDLALGLAAAALAALILVQAALTLRPPSQSLTAEQEVSRDPLDLPALRTLGVDLYLANQMDRAEAIFAFVARQTWRDGPTDGWLMGRRLEQHRYAEAMAFADAMLRQDGGGATRPVIFPALSATIDDPAARAALVARLSASPWWRDSFLRGLADQPTTAGTRAVLSALAAGPAPPSPSEYVPFINRLAASGDYGEALDAWRAIARRGDPDEAYLRDGGFSQVSDGAPFGWRPANGVGVSSEVGAAPDDPSRRVLRVDYDGFSRPTLPAQLLVLPPGRFRVTWRERSQGGGDTIQLAWRIRCSDAAGATLAQADEGASGGVGQEPGQWRPMAMDVVVPAGGCPAQWLELAASPGERRNSVTAWYGQFRVTPQT
jgi:hypothetical protein